MERDECFESNDHTENIPYLINQVYCVLNVTKALTKF